VGPDAPGWAAAAVLGSARAFGTVVALPEADWPPATGLSAAPSAGFSAPPSAGLSATPSAGVEALAWPPAGATAAVLPLAGPGVVFTALGADIRGVAAALDPIDLAKA
jgi:urease accessory protein